MNRLSATLLRRLRALRPRPALLIAGSAVALLSALTPPPGYAIRVKGVGADTVLQLAPSDAGGLVQLDVIARLLGGQLDSTDVGRWRLGLYGATLELAEGAPFAAYNGYALPLLEPTRVIDGHPYVTLQLFSEIIPRFGIGVLWDRTRWEVRLFQSIARRAEPMPLAPSTEPTTTRAVATAPAPVASPATAMRPPAKPPVAAASGGSRSAAGPLPNGLSRRYRVVVDPGHGGVDPGNPGTIVNGRRVREAQLTLAISLRLEKELERLGIDVYMTRRTDTLIARDDRGTIANAQKGDLFLSIHTNAANPNWKNATAARGFETYFLSTARTEDERRVAAMENDVVRFEAPSAAAVKDDPLSFILADLAQNEHLRESSDFATTIQDKLAGSHPGPNRGVKQAGFAVLARAYMPAVLVEIGFGTNKADATWMASPAGQQAAAESLAEATLEYLKHYDRRTRASQR
ncbi:MAG: N-acetylmuramoyl-L-alanine amidase [Gemmatimonadaceae bacterium]|nr:N-acetylmuramoyl-L-alanine amidase [Gemmatimonadaceae bacterium]